MLLLAAIASLLLIHPVLSEQELVGAGLLLSLFFAGILLSGVYAVSESSRTLKISVILGAPALLSSLALEFFETPEAVSVRHMLVALFFGFVAWVILSYVVRAGAVTADKIYGALCVYLLLGLIWASLYSILQQFQPEALQISIEEHSYYVYYSFVTLTTLGYGDYTPHTALARSLSMMEAVTGQIYLTVLVARLVSLHIMHSNEGR